MTTEVYVHNTDIVTTSDNIIIYIYPTWPPMTREVFVHIVIVTAMSISNVTTSDNRILCAYSHRDHRWQQNSKHIAIMTTNDNRSLCAYIAVLTTNDNRILWIYPSWPPVTTEFYVRIVADKDNRRAGTVRLRGVTGYHTVCQRVRTLWLCTCITLWTGLVVRSADTKPWLCLLMKRSSRSNQDCGLTRWLTRMWPHSVGVENTPRLIILHNGEEKQGERAGGVNAGKLPKDPSSVSPDWTSDGPWPCSAASGERERESERERKLELENCILQGL